MDIFQHCPIMAYLFCSEKLFLGTFRFKSWTKCPLLSISIVAGFLGGVKKRKGVPMDASRVGIPIANGHRSPLRHFSDGILATKTRHRKAFPWHENALETPLTGKNAHNKHKNSLHERSHLITPLNSALSETWRTWIHHEATELRSSSEQIIPDFTSIGFCLASIIVQLLSEHRVVVISSLSALGLSCSFGVRSNSEVRLHTIKR